MTLDLRHELNKIMNVVANIVCEELVFKTFVAHSVPCIVLQNQNIIVEFSVIKARSVMRC